MKILGEYSIVSGIVCFLGIGQTIGEVSHGLDLH